MKRSELGWEQGLGQEEAGFEQTFTFQVHSRGNRLQSLSQVESAWHACETGTEHRAGSEEIDLGKWVED